MSLFIMRPDPDGVSDLSLDFIRRVLRDTARFASEAKTRLERTKEMYGGVTTNWEDEQRIAKAEENAEASEAISTHAALKLHWETQGKWRRSYQAPRGKSPKPWITDPSAWFRCFRGNF